MAENKKSVLLYCDIIHTVENLTDEEAGRLFKHYLKYINDLNPKSDRLTEIIFEPIKQNLKRDLKKWFEKSERNSIIAKEGWRKRTHANACERINSDAKHADKDTVTDTDTVKDNVNVKLNNNIEFRKLKFSDTLKPFLETYGKDFLNDFYKYWAEPNKSNTKFRYELEKTWDLKRRLETWEKNEKKFKTNFGNEKLGRADQVIQTHNEVKQYFDNLYKTENNGNSTNKD